MDDNSRFDLKFYIENENEKYLKEKEEVIYKYRTHLKHMPKNMTFKEKNQYNQDMKKGISYSYSNSNYDSNYNSYSNSYSFSDSNSYSYSFSYAYLKWLY